ncbi:MAG: 50S ribosomal protein L31e [Candidatus Bathyarchaeia archaeon]|jgi:large subunit ribosomal protein L31e
MTQETKQEQALQEQEEIEQLPEEETIEETPEQTPAQAEVAPPEEKAEAKPKRKKKEEEIAEERFYTIPLQKALIRPPKKRAPRAMSLLKIFVKKHMKLEMKVDEEEEAVELPQLIVTQEVNEKIWGRGIEKPPRKIKVRVTKDKDGNVTVYLAENQ